MSYENAAATQLLATLCACCARPLVDSKSIETGMGPVCRKKHGYDKADADADWIAVAAVLLPDLADLAASASTDEASRLVLEDAMRERYATGAHALLTQSAREVANAAVYRIAALHSIEGTAAREESAKLVAAIRALGFTRLADVLTDRLIPIRIILVSGGYHVAAPFNALFNEEVRKINGRRWVPNATGKKGGHNFIPLSGTVGLHRALCVAFAGFIALGPKGPFTVGTPRKMAA